MSTRQAATALAALLLASCGADRAPEPGPEPATRASPAPEPAASRSLPRRLRMHDRFDTIEQLRIAIERGELDRARAAASRFDLPVAGELPEAARAHGDAIPERARAIATASDLDGAAAAFSRLLADCGGCHAASGARWEPLAGSPPEGEDLEGRMRRHAWASEAMWEALVLAAPDAFDRAAEVLVEAPLSGEAAPDEEHPPGVRAIEERLREAAVANRTAETLEDRAQTYGTVLATCAGCHTVIARADRERR